MLHCEEIKICWNIVNIRMKFINFSILFALPIRRYRPLNVHVATSNLSECCSFLLITSIWFGMFLFQIVSIVFMHFINATLINFQSILIIFRKSIFHFDTEYVQESQWSNFSSEKPIILRNVNKCCSSIEEKEPHQT